MEILCYINLKNKICNNLGSICCIDYKCDNCGRRYMIDRSFSIIKL